MNTEALQRFIIVVLLFEIDAVVAFGSLQSSSSIDRGVSEHEPLISGAAGETAVALLADKLIRRGREALTNSFLVDRADLFNQLTPTSKQPSLDKLALTNLARASLFQQHQTAALRTRKSKSPLLDVLSRNGFPVQESVEQLRRQLAEQAARKSKQEQTESSLLTAVAGQAGAALRRLLDNADSQPPRQSVRRVATPLLPTRNTAGQLPQATPQSAASGAGRYDWLVPFYGEGASEWRPRGRQTRLGLSTRSDKEAEHLGGRLVVPSFHPLLGAFDGRVDAGSRVRDRWNGQLKLPNDWTDGADFGGHIRTGQQQFDGVDGGFGLPFVGLPNFAG